MLNWFTDLSIRKKLITSFLLVGIIPLIVLGVISLQSASSALEQWSFKQLQAVREIKKIKLKSILNRHAMI